MSMRLFTGCSIGLLVLGVTACSPGAAVVSTPQVPTARPATPLPTAVASPTVVASSRGAPTNAIPARATPTPQAEAPAGWNTYTNRRFGYTIYYPANMEGSGGDADNSWMLNTKTADPDGVARNFIYVSVIPNGAQTSAGEIYNYDPKETGILLGLQVGQKQSLRADPNTDPWFTYIRQPDTMLAGQPAQAYENDQPWEFPKGTKEIRYYLRTADNLYMIGGYVSTTNTDQAGAISEALFQQIVSAFQLTR